MKKQRRGLDRHNVLQDGWLFSLHVELSTGDVRKAPRASRRPWWCTVSSIIKLDFLADPYTMDP